MEKSNTMLQGLLDQDAYQKLPSDVKDIVEDHFALKNNEITKLEAEIQKIRADYGW